MKYFFAFLLSVLLLSNNLKAQGKKPFPIRSFMLDVSRHFFDVNTVKKVIDTLHANNYNYFHWHLTDDQGWRIQLDKYPLLTEVGAWRMEEGKKVGGFYTKKDIREVVAYAQKKGIEIIPEIDLPGHSSALLAAYPNLGCTGKTVPIRTKGGIYFSVFCPTTENQLIIQDILSEITELFPGKYFHIGGDEIIRKNWRKSDEIKKYMQDNDLKNYAALQNFFIMETSNFLKTKGKETIVWGDLVTKEDFSKDLIIMSWKNRDNAITALKNGNKVIITDRHFTYFNHLESNKGKKKIVYYLQGQIPREKTAQFNLYDRSEELTVDQKKKIIGGGACLWTELIEDEETLFDRIDPRINILGKILNDTYQF